jgi:hypothetical protein
MDCPKCGAANPDDADFCGLCLQKFHDAPREAVPAAGQAAQPAVPATQPPPTEFSQGPQQAPPTSPPVDPYDRFFEKPETSLESLITGEPDGRD